MHSESVVRTSVSVAIKLAVTTWVIGCMSASEPTHAVDVIDDTVYVPNPKFDWDARVKQTVVAEDQMITLVVHSARDCIYCARWKGALGGEGSFRSWAKDHPREQLIVVERAALSSSEAPEDYPQELGWLSERYKKDQRLKPGTPTFEIFVEQNLVLRAYGLYSWDDKVFPAIKALESRRESANESRK